MKAAIFLITTFFVIGCKELEKEWRQENWERYHVSLIQVIAQPEKFHGRNIQVIGYFNLEFEGNQICIHEADYLQGIARNCVWVDMDDETKINKQYVVLAGKFDMNWRGHMGLFAGSFKEIERVDPKRSGN